MTPTLKQLLLTPLIIATAAWGGEPSAMANSIESKTDETAASQNSKSVIQGYECVQNKDNYSTITHTDRGPIELIVWESTFWGNRWTPSARCQIISKRFQNLTNQGHLNYINIGRMNNENVICATSETGKEGCLPNGLLITLEPKDNPYDVLEALFYSRKNPSAGGVRRADGKPIDFHQLLKDRSPLQQSEVKSNPPNVLPKPPLEDNQVNPQSPPLPW